LKGGEVNNKGYKAQLEERIREIPRGTTFVASDFSDVAGVRTVRELIRRMIDDGEVMRVLPGIYMRPEHSELLGMQVPADPEDIAYSIARANNWTIAPSGNTALNKLGLSTQVPAVWSFVSDGPYSQKTINGASIKFSHVANRNITGFSPVTLLVVQALKAIGKSGADSALLRKIGQRLSDDDLRTALCETERSTVWMRDSIRVMAQERGLG
jgi:hypothetical protein